MKDPLTIVVERDPETGWLIGEVVELPGCYSQAPDLPSLERNMREAIELHIQSLLAHDQRVPQTDELVHVEELTVGVPE